MADDIIYTVTSSPGGHTAQGSSSPIVVPGLTNGVDYTFTMTASNDYGTSAKSAASSSVRVAAVPDPPTGVSAVGDKQLRTATISFTPPVWDGGSPVTSYTAVASPGGMSSSGAGSPLTITNLQFATSYTFTVRATNAKGNGAFSTASNTVLLTTVPSAPLNPVASAGEGEVSVAFDPPTSDGGTPIIDYTVTSTPGSITAVGSASPIVVTGLDTGTMYTFRVKARNAEGYGPESNSSNAVTPSLFVPTAPLNVSTHDITWYNNQTFVFFDAPVSNGGAPILYYEVESNTGEIYTSLHSNDHDQSTDYYCEATVAASGTYQFRVRGVTFKGKGDWSEWSNTRMFSFTNPDSNGPPKNISWELANASGNNGVSIMSDPPDYVETPHHGWWVVEMYPGYNESDFDVRGSVPLVDTSTQGYGYYVAFALKYWAGTTYSPQGPAFITKLEAYMRPNKPYNVVATGSTGKATVSFTAPYNGRSAITGYTVYSNVGGYTATGTSSPILVPGMAPGDYTFTVTATNAIGTSDASLPSNTTTVSLPVAPGAPIIGTASIDNQESTVTFSPPVDDGGSPITSYTVTSTPEGITASGSASPITVTGLTNGTPYTFTVKATNAYGTGPDSSASNQVTPRVLAVPGAPTIGTATEGLLQATVTFSPPADDGGRPITQYTATSNPGNISQSGASSPIVVTGLSAGTPYTFTVTATNIIGTGPASSASNEVTPYSTTVPDAPTMTLAQPTSGAVYCEWAPNYDGGSPILDYTIYCEWDGDPVDDITTIYTSANFTPLTNGVEYDFYVVARNAMGYSAPSNVLFATPNYYPPDPPLITNVGTPTLNKISLTVEPTGSVGGAPIQMLEVECIETGDRGSVIYDGSPFQTFPITLSTGAQQQNVTFRARSYNRAGASNPSSATSPVYFDWVGSEPVYASGAAIASVTAGDAQVTINSVTAPAYNGGDTILTYTVKYSNGSSSGTSGPHSSFPQTITGLTNNAIYRFSVSATTQTQGAACYGAVSATVEPIPPTTPGSPTIQSVTAGNGTLTVVVTAPASDGGAPIQCYEVCTNASFAGGTLASAESTTIVISGLTIGSYNVYARAKNKVGAGSSTPPFNRNVTTYSPPNAPGQPALSGSPTVGDGQVTIAWTPPSWNGGGGISTYRIYTYPGGAYITDATSPATVTGLTNGNNYRFAIAAVGAAGGSPVGGKSGATINCVPTGGGGPP